MSMVKQVITDSEYAIMKILWREDKKLMVGDVCNLLEGKEWTPSTVSTLMQRLAKKGVIGYEKKGKANYYYPILKQEEYNVNESRSLLSKLYDGSLKNFAASLVQSDAISKDEIDDLKKMFELE